MAPHLRGKTVAVSGGCSGIGLAVAKRCALAGAEHIFIGDICGRDETQLVHVQKHFREILLPEGSEESKVHISYLDVSDAGSVDAWVQNIVNETGGLDLAANIAGVAQPAYARPPNMPSILHEGTEEWDRILNVNLGGVFNCARAEVRAMVHRASTAAAAAAAASDDQEACHHAVTTSDAAEPSLSPRRISAGRGAIVNMASLTACTPLGDIFAYGTSKAGVAHFTACLARDTWKHGIRVNAVSPGM